MSDHADEDAYATQWKGDNANPESHSIHGPTKAVDRENLEDTLNDIVDEAMRNMKTDLTREEREANNEEPVDEAELLRLKMKYKYKYKYKYQMQQGQQKSQDANALLESAYDPASSFGSATEQGDEAEEEDFEPLKIQTPTDDVTLARVKKTKAEAKAELDATWKLLAAPPTEDDSTGPPSPGQVRSAMQAQRDTYMPISRWLRKLVARLEELEATLEEAKAKAEDDARASRSGHHGLATQTNAQRDLAAEDAGNARVQAALHEDGEEEVNSANLMHTTKQYDMISKLRKRLGMSAISKSSPKKDQHAEQPDTHNDEANMAGDWNKSILVTKKGEKHISLGKNQKTFKEFRADPWQRQAIAKKAQA